MGRAPDQRVVFALFGVDGHAPWEEVRRAFRDAVRASHPDLHGGDPEAEQRLKTLNVAWESVNSPSKWAQYVVQQVSAETTRPSSSAPPTFGRLRVQRQRRGGTGLRQWRLELDGDVIASIANGDISVLEASPGRHRLRVFYEGFSSLPFEVDLHAGQELHLGCRQVLSSLRSLTSPKRALALELLGSRRF
jgi:hypothetical protein